MSLEEMPHSQWLKHQNLTSRQITLLGFHQWMRKQTDLDSGTIVEYRKKIHQLMKKNAKLKINREELSTRQNTAVNKFQEYINQKKPVFSNTKGDSRE